MYSTLDLIIKNFYLVFLVMYKVSKILKKIFDSNQACHLHYQILNMRYKRHNK